MGEQFNSWLEGNSSFLRALAIFAAIILSITFAGWGSFITEVEAIATGGNNLEALKTACQSACDTSNSFKYCEHIRFAKYDEPIMVTHMVPTPGKDAIGFEAVTRPLTKAYGTCEEMARGMATRLSNRGVIQDYSLSFPLVMAPKCLHLCE